MRVPVFDWEMSTKLLFCAFIGRVNMQISSFCVYIDVTDQNLSNDEIIIEMTEKNAFSDVLWALSILMVLSEKLISVAAKKRIYMCILFPSNKQKKFNKAKKKKKM